MTEKTMWNSMHNVPKDRPVVVFLEEANLRSRKHIARYFEKGKGVSMVGGYFHFDMPKPLCWAEAPSDPSVEALELFKK